MQTRRAKGQSVSTEYVIMVLFVIAALTAMSVFVRRALQARAMDTDKAMIVRASAALGQNILREYEPYYINSTANTDAYDSSFERVAAGRGLKIDKVSARDVSSGMVQAPPKDAD